MELFLHCPLLVQFSWPYERENQNLIIVSEWAISLEIALWDTLWNVINHKLFLFLLWWTEFIEPWNICLFTNGELEEYTPGE